MTQQPSKKAKRRRPPGVIFAGHTGSLIEVRSEVSTNQVMFDGTWVDAKLGRKIAEAILRHCDYLDSKRKQR